MPFSIAVVGYMWDHVGVEMPSVLDPPFWLITYIVVQFGSPAFTQPKLQRSDPIEDDCVTNRVFGVLGALRLRFTRFGRITE